VCGTGLAATTDPGDLWWNPAESGWGLQLVQGGDVVFATLYVYDAQSRPTFYTATLASTGNGYSGDLFATSGPWFGAPDFEPASVSARKVGTFSFTPVNATIASLQYSVDNVIVNKQVQRQTLRFDDYSGHYIATVNRVTTSCGDAALAGEHTDTYDITIAQTGTLVTMNWNGPSSFTCRFSGTYDQAGRFGSMTTGYDCTSAENGNMSFDQLTLRSGMVAGHFQGHGLSDGCDHRGQFVALQPF